MSDDHPTPIGAAVRPQAPTPAAVELPEGKRYVESIASLDERQSFVPTERVPVREPQGFHRLSVELAASED
jgi:hypothetical protein